MPTKRDGGRAAVVTMKAADEVTRPPVAIEPQVTRKTQLHGVTAVNWPGPGDPKKLGTTNRPSAPLVPGASALSLPTARAKVTGVQPRGCRAWLAQRDPDDGADRTCARADRHGCRHRGTGGSRRPYEHAADESRPSGHSRSRSRSRSRSHSRETFAPRAPPTAAATRRVRSFPLAPMSNLGTTPRGESPSAMACRQDGTPPRQWLQSRLRRSRPSHRRRSVLRHHVLIPAGIAIGLAQPARASRAHRGLPASIDISPWRRHARRSHPSRGCFGLFCKRSSWFQTSSYPGRPILGTMQGGPDSCHASGSVSNDAQCRGLAPTRRYRPFCKSTLLCRVRAMACTSQLRWLAIHTIIGSR